MRARLGQRSGGANLLVMSLEEGDVHWSPWYSQPDPRKPFFVPARVLRLIRRCPRDYFMIGERLDGSEVEFRLTAGAFRMELPE